MKKALCTFKNKYTFRFIKAKDFLRLNKGYITDVTFFFAYTLDSCTDRVILELELKIHHKVNPKQCPETYPYPKYSNTNLTGTKTARMYAYFNTITEMWPAIMFLIYILAFCVERNTYTLILKYIVFHLKDI